MSDEPNTTAEQWHRLADERSAEIVRLARALQDLADGNALYAATNLQLQQELATFKAANAQLQTTAISLTQDLELERKEHARCRIAQRVVCVSNTWMSTLLDKVSELADLWSDPPEGEVPDHLTEGEKVVAAQCGQKLLDLLNDWEPLPPLPYPGAIRASFHFRAREERGKGTFEALPGDGCGFCEPTDTHLSLTFDCGGVLCCANLTYEFLRPLLAAEGLELVKAANIGRVEQCPNASRHDGGHSLGYRTGGRCDWCGKKAREGLPNDTSSTDDVQVRAVQGDGAPEPKQG